MKDQSLCDVWPKRVQRSPRRGNVFGLSSSASAYPWSRLAWECMFVCVRLLACLLLCLFVHLFFCLRVWCLLVCLYICVCVRMCVCMHVYVFANVYVFIIFEKENSPPLRYKSFSRSKLTSSDLVCRRLVITNRWTNKLKLNMEVCVRRMSVPSSCSST